MDTDLLPALEIMKQLLNTQPTKTRNDTKMEHMNFGFWAMEINKLPFHLPKDTLFTLPLIEQKKQGIISQFIYS